jgi:hypothetical protein
VLAEKPRGGLQHGSGVAQRPKRVIEFEEEREPVFVRTQLRIRLLVFERCPDPIRDLLGKRDFVRRPRPRRAAVDPERTDEASLLDQQGADVGANTRRLQRCAFFRRMRFRGCVVDGYRSAFEDICGATAT